eukprot:comp19261_c0_seq1/m.22061 comp19261_c0_seq1/g.22061  ORF comp19261_c0_seq1/g.22061 comp19261_c0_seq1/m.22061 type:complete len:431 (-) comp19261_c0_seq1:103-1395(-)
MSAHIRLATCAFLLCTSCPSFSLPLESVPPSLFSPPVVSFKSVAFSNGRKDTHAVLTPAELLQAAANVAEQENAVKGGGSEEVGVLEAGGKLVAAADSALKALVLPPKITNTTTAPAGGLVVTRNDGKVVETGETKTGMSVVEEGVSQSNEGNVGEFGVGNDGKTLEANNGELEGGGIAVSVEGMNSGKSNEKGEKEQDENAAAEIDYFDGADSQEALHEPVIETDTKKSEVVLVKAEGENTGEKKDIVNVGIESVEKHMGEGDRVVGMVSEMKEETVALAHPNPAAAEKRQQGNEEGKDEMGKGVNLRTDDVLKNVVGGQENAHNEESFEGLMHDAEHGSPEWEREKVLIEKAEVPLQQENTVQRPKLKTQVLTEEYLMDAAQSQPDGGRVSWAMIGVVVTVIIFFVTIRTRRYTRRASMFGKHRGSLY